MFQAKFYDQMMLLKEKTGEQERFIAQIKESMWQMTKSFNDSLKTSKKSYITLVEDPKWYAKPFLVGTP